MALTRHPPNGEGGDGGYPEGIAHARCAHDNQHIIGWAAMEATGIAVLHSQLDWPTTVLGSRGYPLAHLADDLDIAAEVVPAADTAARLRDGAAHVRAGLEADPDDEGR